MSSKLDRRKKALVPLLCLVSRCLNGDRCRPASLEDVYTATVSTSRAGECMDLWQNVTLGVVSLRWRESSTIGKNDVWRVVHPVFIQADES